MPIKKKKVIRRTTVKKNVAKKIVSKRVIKKKKKSVNRAISAMPKMPKPLGTITHYFSDIEVAIVKLMAPLSQGDVIRIMGGDTTDFNQKATSLHRDHVAIKKAKKGMIIGLKVAQKVREGYRVYPQT